MSIPGNFGQLIRCLYLSVNKRIPSIKFLQLCTRFSTATQFCSSYKNNESYPQARVTNNSRVFGSQFQYRPRKFKLTGNLSELDLDEFIASLERQPRTPMSRTFMIAWVDLMVRYPSLLTKVSWPELIRRCKDLDKFFDEKVFSGVLFHACFKCSDITVAEEYLKYDKNPSLTVLTQYIRELANVEREVSESKILDIYEKIKAKNHGVWDLNSGERVIPALVRTSKWKESIEIIKKMEIGGPMPPLAYSYVATAAFNVKDFNLGWSLLNKIKHQRISDQAFIAYLRNVEQTEENVSKLLDFLDLYEQFPTINLIKALQHYFEDSLGYKGTDTNILPSKGSCMNCRTKLQQNELKPEEYKILVDSFMNKVLQDEDIFLNTSPTELTSYKNFINTKAPFDYVLDGLNVSFAHGKAPPHEAVYNLENLVNQLSDGRNRILIIGRNHMSRWPQKNMRNIQKLAELYLINNDSNDDPFILYATLRSGQKAKFVSKDMMRNHTFRLQDPVLARLFKRWRLSQQLTIESRGPNLRLVPFTPTLPVPQKDMETGLWHIPYDLDKLASPYDLPSRWLCLKPKK